MTFKAKVASALSFAHLAGLGRGKAAASAEDDDDQKKKDEEAKAKAKAKADAEGDEPDEDDKKKAGARAEDDEPDAEDDAPEDDESDEKKKSAKGKAKADDGDDEDDEKAKAGAKRERARCAAIFGSPAAAKNVALAAELAFNTDLSASQAIAVLGKAPSATGTNANRAAGNPRIGSAGAPEATGKQAIDSRWDRAFSAVTPQRRK